MYMSVDLPVGGRGELGGVWVHACMWRHLLQLGNGCVKESEKKENIYM